MTHLPPARPHTPLATALRACLTDMLQPPDPAAWLHRLVAAGLAAPPLPGGGNTLDRWRALAEVASQDLSLAKLYEAHADALAILAELGGATARPDETWAVWCAEPPDHRIAAVSAADGDWVPGLPLRLSGTKAWCSGAATVSHALISAWTPDGRPCLAAVRMAQPGVTVTEDGWHAVGMADAVSVNVVLADAQAVLVGTPGGYVDRPGFMQGAAGVAACWYGALVTVADYVRRGVKRGDDPHRQAHLGAIDVALAQAAALLREAAQAIDATPSEGCTRQVVRARLAVEAAVETVLIRASRALGAGPLCRDVRFARLMADLPVFVRQSHAERDQAAHGKTLSTTGREAWTL